MNTVLVPTDFSPTAENAMSYAIELAKAYNLQVTLFHAVSLANIGSVNSVHATDNGERLLADANFKMSEAVTQLSKAHPEVNFFQVTRIGLMMDLLNDLAKEILPIAIVMGITGAGTGMNKVLGSNALNALQQLNYPIMIVPKDTNFKPIHKIAFACDLKKVVSSTPLVSIRAFAKLFGAEVHVLNVDYQNRNYTPATSDELSNLDEMLSDTKHFFHFVDDEDIQRALNAFIEENNIDLLLMIPKKHNLWENLFRRSKTKEMAYHSIVPVLAVHMD
jgi:nucleotide-binding universal stress UspA family protein